MADIKKANSADLSAAKKVEKVVKPAAELSIAERRPAGQFHLDLNPKPDPGYLRAHRDTFVRKQQAYEKTLFNPYRNPDLLGCVCGTI